jgi:uncharacterized membrane protein YkvA (DUF1232 family)
LLAVAVAYAVSPIDLIPDFIPVLGHVNDVVVLSVLVWLTPRSMPPGLLAEHRSKTTREGYNEIRPLESPGNRTPVEYLGENVQIPVSTYAWHQKGDTEIPQNL